MLAAAKARAVVVVEGYIDALAMHQAGIVNTVALMGTSVSEQQIAALKCLAPTVVLMLDGDQAGIEAILRPGALAVRNGLDVLVASMPSGSDPAALVQRRGAEVAREVVAHARAFARFRVQRQIECSDLSTAEAKDRLVGELREVFIDIPPSAVREDLIAVVASRLGLEPALVRKLMPTRDIAVRGQPVVADAHAQSPSGSPGTQPAGASVVDPSAAATLPSGTALQRLFPEALTRRAAAHIRLHPTDPVVGLPEDDLELVSLIGPPYRPGA